MTLPKQTLRPCRRHLRVSLLALLATSSGLAQQAQPAASAAASPEPIAEDEVVVLSPFEVIASNDKGYFAANTLAGSRMSTNLADLAASISVINKQQLEDTASVDINDIFRYEVNTEGSSTYTPSGANNLSMRNDGVRDYSAGATLGSGLATYTNAGANRVRGLGTPSSAVNYYPAIGSVPMDAYNTQSVEISRGPNSLLFGMGSPAGIVNQTTAQAQLNKKSGSISTRLDQYGSMRGTFGFNLGLIEDKLAIYGAAVHDDRRFDRKPAFDRTDRLFGTITYKPFSKTTFRASVEKYTNDNRRPNSLTPRDFVTEWNLAGQPYYDPMTGKISSASGKTLGAYVVNASSPQANLVRDTIATLPGYDASKWNAAKTTYNGISIFGDAALTTSTGFIANSKASNNILFAPGITWSNLARSTMQIADGELVNWFQPLRGQRYRTTWGKGADPSAAADLYPTEAQIWANSTWSDMYNRGQTVSAGWSALGNNISGYKYAGVTDSSIYDWREVNINAMNFGHDKNTNYNVEFEQELPGNLFLSAGWFRQDYDSRANYTVAQLNTATLFVDTNKSLPDGASNPYFGKVYVEDQDPDRYINKQLDDHYRAMLAWTPDFTRNKGWSKWLGRHQVLGMWSRDESMATAIRQRLNYVDSTSMDGKYRYMNNQNAKADGSLTGWNFQSTSLRRSFYLASPDDPNGTVTRASGNWDYLNYSGDIKVYDYANSSFKTVNMTTVFNSFDAHTARNQRIVDSKSAAMSNYLWKERIVTTFGVRKDDYKARTTTTDVIYRQELSTGDTTNDVNYLGAFVPAGRPVAITAALPSPQKWVDGVYQTDTVFNRFNRWDILSGTTRTLGGVFRPFKGWEGIERRANGESQFWQFLRSFGVSYNQSGNFNPPPSAKFDAFGSALGKPTGEGKDIGIQFSLLDDRLFARVTWFEASNQNERTSSTLGLDRLVGHMDTTAFRGWASTIARINMGDNPLDDATWNATIPTGSAKDLAIRAAVEPIWQQAYSYYDNLAGMGGIGATQDAKAKGIEAEINYNPTLNWTMKVTYGRQDTKYSNVLSQFDAWYAVRNPVWQAAKASSFLLPQYQSLVQYTTTGGRQVDLTSFMTSYGFNSDIRLDNANGWTNVTNYYNAVVLPNVLLNRELQGQSAPGQRKNRASFITSYTFTEGRLKGFFVGGSERWEDRSVIGYYGRASGANGTLIDVSDTTRPIYDSANFYTDLWIGYRTRIAGDKYGLKVQLNCANVFESGKLQTVGVNLDGSPYAFRIVDPRLLQFTTTLEF